MTQTIHLLSIREGLFSLTVAISIPGGIFFPQVPEKFLTSFALLMGLWNVREKSKGYWRGKLFLANIIEIME